MPQHPSSAGLLILFLARHAIHAAAFAAGGLVSQHPLGTSSTAGAVAVASLAVGLGLWRLHAPDSDIVAARMLASKNDWGVSLIVKIHSRRGSRVLRR